MTKGSELITSKRNVDFAGSKAITVGRVRTLAATLGVGTAVAIGTAGIACADSPTVQAEESTSGQPAGRHSSRPAIRQANKSARPADTFSTPPAAQSRRPAPAPKAPLLDRSQGPVLVSILADSKIAPLPLESGPTDPSAKSSPPDTFTMRADTSAPPAAATAASVPAQPIATALPQSATVAGMVSPGTGTGIPTSLGDFFTWAVAMVTRDIRTRLSGSVTDAVSVPPTTSLAAAATTTGTTTTITWAWGTHPVLNFNPATDKLNFAWMRPSWFTVKETSGSTVISLLDNNHSYTLKDVPISQLTMANIIAKDTRTVAKWQQIIGAATPTLSISDAGTPEGNSGTANLGFAVTLSRTSTKPITVNYATANGTAIGGTDYLSTAGTITFAAGESTKSVNVGILGDTTVEPDETFTVTLTNPTGATLTRTIATGTIINGDVAAPPSTDVSWGTAFFSPYIQMGGWPTPNLTQRSTAAGTSLMILAFIQADSNGRPSWGGNSTLGLNSTNSQANAINTSITNFRATGGDAMISFGGADGTSLSQYYAAHNLSAQALANAYGSVVDAYGINHLDFDIEGSALSNSAVVGLQAQSLALLQQAHPDVQIWLTLPVLPTGFLADGKYAVESALKAGVKLAGVNIMAMDYGESAAPTTGPNAQTMGAYAVQAAQSSYTQLSALYAKYGLTYSWSQLGITPIIGVNDITTEVFTVADALTLVNFAKTKGVRMLSMWSLERDTPGALGQAVWNASGVSDPAGSFSDVFNDYGAAPSTVYL